MRGAMPALWSLSDNLVFREKLGNFPLRGVRRVGTMDRIFADRFCVRLANGSRGGLGRVGSAHDLTVFRDGIFSFQHLHHDGSGYHKLDKLTKERTLAMHGIEFLRLLAGNAHALLRDDTQACLLDDRIDGARQIAPGRVGFEDRKSALNRHRIFLHWRIIEEFIGELVPRGLYRRAFQAARSVASGTDVYCRSTVCWPVIKCLPVTMPGATNGSMTPRPRSRMRTIAPIGGPSSNRCTAPSTTSWSAIASGCAASPPRVLSRPVSMRSSTMISCSCGPPGAPKMNAFATTSAH